MEVYPSRLVEPVVIDSAALLTRRAYGRLAMWSPHRRVVR